MKIKKEDYPVFYMKSTGFAHSVFKDETELINDVMDFKKRELITILPTQSLKEIIKKNFDKLALLINQLPEGRFCILLEAGRQIFVKSVVKDGKPITAAVEYEHDLVFTVGFGDGKYKSLDKWNMSMYTALRYMAFYFFAEVETKTLDKKNKKAHYQDCKYVSEFDEPIIIFNSMWFQNLVKSESFNVRGHFAFRAHGEGRKERRLVWINEFQKSGYTREAGITKANNSAE